MDQVVRAATPEQIAAAEKLQVEKQRLEQLANISPPKFVADEDERRIVVPLSFPVEWGGVTYTEITITRPTIKMWRRYQNAVVAAVRERGPEAEDDVDMPYVSAPAVVINALDFIDGSVVEAAMAGFFDRSSLNEMDTEGGEKSSSTSGSGEQSPGS